MELVIYQSRKEEEQLHNKFNGATSLIAPTSKRIVGQSFKQYDKVIAYNLSYANIRELELICKFENTKLELI